MAELRKRRRDRRCVRNVGETCGVEVRTQFGGTLMRFVASSLRSEPRPRDNWRTRISGPRSHATLARSLGVGLQGMTSGPRGAVLMSDRGTA